uniref:Gibberellin regulated protein n=1 Tax=Leersia perrieri TaxID=77586 RepID=A0A0D9W5Y2_9ORYZ
MALGKLTVVALLAALLFLTTIKAADYPPAPPPGPPPHKIVDPGKDCLWACNLRCSDNSRKNMCSRACLTCCSVCHCVPAGTAGNRETCGRCYTAWTTHGNKTKCP